MPASTSHPRPRPKLPLLIGLSSILAILAGAVGVLALILVELSGGGVTRVNERVVSGSQAAMVIVGMALVVVGMFVVGLAALRHERWTRPVLVLAFVALIGALAWQVTTVPPWTGIAAGALLMLCVLWYFYHKRSVVTYYAAVEEANFVGFRYGQARADLPIGWWRRHWGWAALVFAVFCGVLGERELQQWRHMPVIVNAVSVARGDARTDSALGTPVRMGLFPAGQIEFAAGKAALSIPVRGPKAAGLLFVTAARDSGDWRYTSMVLARPGGSDTLVWVPSALATAAAPTLR